MLFLVDCALVILHLHAVVAVALALQFVAVERLAFTADFARDVFLVVRTSVAVLVGRLVRVVSWFSFTHLCMPFGFLVCSSLLGSFTSLVVSLIGSLISLSSLLGSFTSSDLLSISSFNFSYFFFYF